MSLPCISKSDLGVNGPEVKRPYMEPGEQEALLALVSSIAPAPEVMVEIGVNIGLTAQAVLQHVPSINRYIGVDVEADYRFEGAWQQHDRPAEPGRLVKDDPRFRLMLRGNGKAAKMPQSSDVVFIDGDHGPRNVLNDSLWAASVVRPGGMIIWHDYKNTPAEVTGVLDWLHAEGRNLVHITGTSLVFERVAA
jgi:predicted O-methyltransferase YrrM